MTDSELCSTHEHSSYHRDELARSDKAGCFHCETVFPAANVWEWVDDGQTGMCPLCHIDSILPDALVPITPELLAAMHRYWFEQAETTGH